MTKGRINHDPKIVWVVGDRQKKFQPLLSIFCLSKENDKNCHYTKNGEKLEFMYLEGNFMLLTPLNPLCFRAYMVFCSPIRFEPMLQAKK